MDKKPLGRTGVDIPEIGMGAWNYQGDPAIMRRALELGSFLIDTAENYGTEPQVGRAVGGNRDDYFIATKVSPEHFSYNDVLAAAERSLKALGTDHIDLYQLHAPSPHVPIQETMRAMDHLVAAGKVRFVGVSNFSVEELREADEALGSGSVVENQIKYSLFDREFAESVIPYCEEHGVTVLAYSSLEHGRFADELSGNEALSEAMDRVCAETAKTPAQVILNWVLRSPAVVTIPQTNRVERVAENCAASGWRLSDEQHAALAEAAGASRSSHWWR
ncbi:MAG: aldo/keto reductase [Chloroflexi bacterium]|nr:aldo/keto reductase [Chloroflexota bacterium]